MTAVGCAEAEPAGHGSSDEDSKVTPWGIKNPLFLLLPIPRSSVHKLIKINSHSQFAGREHIGVHVGEQWTAMSQLLEGQSPPLSCYWLHT